MKKDKKIITNKQQTKMSSNKINICGDIIVLNVIIDTMIENYLEADASSVSDGIYLKISNTMKNLHEIKNDDGFKTSRRLAVRHIKENVEDDIDSDQEPDSEDIDSNTDSNESSE